MEPSVSFCLVACNEQARLERCLGSVRGLCHELLVIDTGSEDATVTRAQELGAEVRHFKWVDDFAAARNYGLSLLSGDWVLMLDADEHLMPEALLPIRELLRDPDLLVINLLRREAGAAQSPWSAVSRLFRRHPQILFERPYHAMIDDSVERLLTREPHWKVHDLNIAAIAHEGYRPGEIVAQQKAKRARRAMERYHAKHSGDPYVCNKLGALLLSLGEIDQAESLLRTGLQTVAQSSASAPLRYELHLHLGMLHRSRNEWKQARNHYRLALKQGLDLRLSVGASFNLAALDQQQGQFENAIRSFNKVVKLVPDLAQAHLNLGLAHFAMGRKRRAKDHYLQALEIDPGYADAHRNLGVLHLAEGQEEEAMACFRETLSCYELQTPEKVAAFLQALAASGLDLEING